MLKNKKYILGIDGGGSKTHAILFDSHGDVKSEAFCTGTNLYVYKEHAISKILNLLNDIEKKSKVNLLEIDAFGIGLAGTSDKNHRELLLREIDRINIADKSIILSDVECSFKLLCPSGVGLLIIVGTGVICFGKNKNDKIVKVAGNGHDAGDIGSGYWIGKETIKNLTINFSIINVDKDLNEIFNIVKNIFEIENIELLDTKINSDEKDSVYKVSSIAEGVIDLAEKGNDIALSIIQKGTITVAEYIISAYNELNFNKDYVMIACEGSIIKNDFYRKVLNDALQFEFKKIHWIFSNLSSAFGAGLMAAKFKNIKVSINKLVENSEK